MKPATSSRSGSAGRPSVEQAAAADPVVEAPHCIPAPVSVGNAVFRNSTNSLFDRGLKNRLAARSRPSAVTERPS